MLRYKGHLFAGDGAACACCSIVDKVASTDPTGTKALRSKLRATIGIKWNKLRVLTKQIIVEHDLLQLNAGGLMPVKSPATNQGGTKIQMFQRWFDQGLQSIVLEGDGTFMKPLLNQAYMDGVSFAAAQIGRRVQAGGFQHTEDTLFQLAVVELQGIIEAVSQQSVRAVANALLTNSKPLMIVRQVFAIIEKIGRTRSNAMVNQMAVASFNQAALDSYEAAKIKQVGVVAEAKASAKVGDAKFIEDAPRKRGFGSRVARSGAGPSKRTIQRIKKVERSIEALGKVNVVTAGDENVCPICEDIADKGPYTINAARSLIPAHPNCRCAFVPIGEQ